ncbi:hypothetical protein F0562_013783 [Nyssa sinensis]|uniref:MADS-box domain-containing protein n=1 Tax=Nyssa sinensis TaxID=561372 RepID=A0A5J4ZQU0_9ASTE|nr:hypothetical protein F0562_013783 [Nyssa sinensis]
MSLVMKKKLTEGRKKIEIKRITNENSRTITFSKRRNGIFKKASELCTLCGADPSIIIFSLRGKAFSFGNPNVKSVIDKFLNQNPQPNEGASEHARSSHEVRELNQQLHELNKQLKVGREKENLSQKTSLPMSSNRFKAYVNELGLPELEQLKGTMEKLKKKVSRRVNELRLEASSKHTQEVDFSNIGNNETEASSIPCDWLSSKLYQLDVRPENCLLELVGIATGIDIENPIYTKQTSTLKTGSQNRQI